MQSRRGGFTLIELMIVVAIIGLLAALALPNFVRFQAKAKQSEVKSNLKAIWSSQKAYYANSGMYLDLADVIGFAPEFNNRYNYYLQGAGAGTETRNVIGNPTLVTAASASCTTVKGIGQISVDQVKWGTSVPAAPPTVAARTVNTGGLPVAVNAVGVLPAGAPGTGCCPNGVCEFTSAASGNIDSDLEWDNWSISSQGGLGGASVCTGGVTAASNYLNFASGQPVNECDDVALY